MSREGGYAVSFGTDSKGRFIDLKDIKSAIKRAPGRSWAISPDRVGTVVVDGRADVTVCTLPTHADGRLTDFSQRVVDFLHVAKPALREVTGKLEATRYALMDRIEMNEELQGRLVRCEFELSLAQRSYWLVSILLFTKVHWVMSFAAGFLACYLIFRVWG